MRLYPFLFLFCGINNVAPIFGLALGGERQLSDCQCSGSQGDPHFTLANGGKMI